MKPKVIEFIPIYGVFRYFKRYFKLEKAGSNEALIANWMELYHCVLGLIIIGIAIVVIDKFI